MILKRGTPPPGADSEWSGRVYVCPCCSTEFLPAMTQQRAGETCHSAYCEVCKTQHCYELEETYIYPNEEQRRMMQRAWGEMLTSMMGVDL